MTLRSCEIYSVYFKESSEPSEVFPDKVPYYFDNISIQITITSENILTYF